MAKLVHVRGDGTTQDILLDRERITIGRRPDNDVCLAQRPVSGEHAAVVTIFADSFLEDLGSTNGTLVNGSAVVKHFLRDGDEIDIGCEILVYLADDAATLDAPPRHGDRAPDRDARSRGDTGAAAVPPISGGNLPGRHPTDGTVSISSRPVDTIGRFVAEEVRRAAAEAAAVHGAAPDESGATGPASASAPELKVLNGTNAGRVCPLARSETLVGRAGVRVVALRRAADEIHVVPVEGTAPLTVNGTPVAPDGRRLAAGDVLEIAGTRLELVVPSDTGAV
jgi:predicted component of type VI protein secretion system